MKALNKQEVEIIKQLNMKVEDNPGYWDFIDEKVTDHIHGLSCYPAKMVPKMQSEIIDLLLEFDPTITNILDPFMGSGTIPIEGMLRGLDVIGMDINPFAYFITKAKSNVRILKTIEEKKEQLFKRLDEDRVLKNFHFNKIEKWYREDIIEDLKHIRECILDEEDDDVRLFYWTIFFDVSRLANNSQKSTFKLHIKHEDVIDSFEFNSKKKFKYEIEDGIKSLKEFYDKLGSKNHLSKFGNYKSKVKLICGDSINELNDFRKFKDNSIDLVVTSPPYGDNHTTVTYGQFSVLGLKWMNGDPLFNDSLKSSINNFNAIDSMSLGGSFKTFGNINIEALLSRSKSLEDMFKILDELEDKKKVKKVMIFSHEFDECLEKIARKLKPNKYVVMTVGNRRVHDMLVPFNKIIEDLGIKHNLMLVHEFDRKIPRKRMAEKISRLDNQMPVESMKKEFVLILKKIAD